MTRHGQICHAMPQFGVCKARQSRLATTMAGIPYRVFSIAYRIVGHLQLQITVTVLAASRDAGRSVSEPCHIGSRPMRRGR